MTYGYNTTSPTMFRRSDGTYGNASRQMPESAAEIEADLVATYGARDVVVRNYESQVIVEYRDADGALYRIQARTKAGGGHWDKPSAALACFRALWIGAEIRAMKARGEAV